MLKGFAYTTPTIGRIAIGCIEADEGERRAKRLDYFMVTSQLQVGDDWVPHPVGVALEKELPANEKLRRIPIRLQYNNIDLNFSDSYQAFEDDRPVCVGDGHCAKRRNGDSVTVVACPQPDSCELGRALQCKPFGKLLVQIDGQEDSLSSFVFRTRGFNSVRTLRCKLESLKAMLGERLAGTPLYLTLRAKANRRSRGVPFYYADLILRNDSVEGLQEALQGTDNPREALAKAGADFDALEARMLALQANGVFSETSEDVGEFEDLLQLSSADLGDEEDPPGAELKAAPSGTRPSSPPVSVSAPAFPGLQALRNLAPPRPPLAGSDRADHAPRALPESLGAGGEGGFENPLAVRELEHCC